MLRRLATPIRRRLLVERHLDSAMHGALLAAALEHVGAAAFVLGKQGRILEANTAASALLESRRDDCARMCSRRRAAQAGLPDRSSCCCASRGPRTCRLRSFARATATPRIASSIGAAAARWQLSPRQADILTRLVQGEIHR